MAVMDWLNSKEAEFYSAGLKNIFYGVQGTYNIIVTI